MASCPWKTDIYLTDLICLKCLSRSGRTPAGPIPFLEFRRLALLRAAETCHTFRNFFLGECLSDKLFGASAALP